MNHRTKIQSIESSINFLLASEDSSITSDDSESKSSTSLPFEHDIHTVDPQDHKHNGRNMYVRIREYDAINLNDRERDGYLTDRIIEVCSCCLENSARPGKFVLSTCNLSRKGLKNIELIQYHPYLKHLDLSKNQLTSVEALGYLPFLEYLDVSHNLINALLEFKAPINLSYVNYSYNLVNDFIDLTDFWSLVYLDVSHNLITRIWGLGALRYLMHLNLSHNAIKYLNNINNMAIETLILDFNSIEKFEEGKDVGLKTLNNLTQLSVSNNMLKSLTLVDNMRNVEIIDASFNLITDLVQMVNLRNLPYLHALDLQGNPVVDNAMYRQACLNYSVRLRILDGKIIDPTEKGHAVYAFSKCYLKRGRQNYATLELIRQMQTPHIDSTTIPCYEKYVSIIVLVGPLVTNKRNLIKRIVEAFPKFAKRGVSCTTRPKYEFEVDGLDYYYISKDEFQKRLLAGNFMCVAQKYGYNYSTEYNELRKISEGKGILLLQGDMDAALQIRSKFPNTKLVLAVPRARRAYRKWLKQKYECTPWICNNFYRYSVKHRFSELSIDSFGGPSGSNEQHQLDAGERTTVDEEKEASKLKHQAKEDNISSYREKSKTGFTNLRDSGQTSILKSTTASKVSRQSIIKLNVSFNAIPKTISPSSIKSSDYGSEVSSIVPPRGTSNVAEVDSSNPYLLSTLSSSNQKVPQDVAKLNYLTSTNSELETGSSLMMNSETEDMDEVELISEAPGNYVEKASAVARSTNRALQLRLVNSSFLNARACSFSEPPRRTSTEEELEFKLNLSPQFESIYRQSRLSIEVLMEMCASKMISGNDSEFLLAQTSCNQIPYRSQAYLDYFIHIQMQKLLTYTHVYDENPGLFYTKIYTDEEEEAFETMSTIMKTCVQEQYRYIKKREQCKDAYVCKEMRAAKLKLIDDITR